ncbi:hypothetical protein BO82DRAFT_404838 [Aspergillus uvarum CBS 121591]|uniref:Uncharacterized protein n=1 Tax=Aspergillus uvarum CBS 121591 TaxID=1448315 RepID=A0A319CT41_9EURO|nr:hypothetical protein BO82DRAFT_404838 [Aspergillus uvarum CBS 121591]PYH78778.1 hypothetical protein BO82DRAFT_404838 [Aspergillus uvarum CBS 121591]
MKAMIATFLARWFRPWMAQPSDDLDVPPQNDPVEVAISLSKEMGDLFEEVGEENGGLSEEVNALSKNLLNVHEYLGRIQESADPDPRIRGLALDLLRALRWIKTWPDRFEAVWPGDENLPTIVEAIGRHQQGDPQARITEFLEEAPRFLVSSPLITARSILELGQSTTLSDEIAILMSDRGASQGDSISRDTAFTSILSALWGLSVCKGCERSSTEQGHVGMLYLGRPEREDGAKSMLDVLISPPSLQYWQEFGCITSQEEITLAREAHLAKMDETNLCTKLGEENHARLLLVLEDGGFSRHIYGYPLHHEAAPGREVPLSRALEEYRLDIPQKIALCHAVARGFWQLYETKMMLAKWSDTTIWFRSNSDDPAAPLPCKVFISIPFALTEHELEEFSTTDLIHRCPRIFSLGVLLLEICLGRPIQTPQLQQDTTFFVREMNKTFCTTSKLFGEFQDDSWTGYTGKFVLSQAIDACVQGSIFKFHTTMDILQRRKILEEKVVRPLEWLASSLPSNYKGNNHCERKDHSEPPPPSDSPTLANPNPADPSQSDNSDNPPLVSQPSASSHAGGVQESQSWMQKLRDISVVRRDTAMTPTRVAVLDTGCNLATAYFQGHEMRPAQIKGYKDFITGAEGTQSMSDSDGHGTFMATLVAEVTLFADIFVAKVAEDTDMLRSSQKRIGEAIRWAAIENGCSIISMSFAVDDAGEVIERTVMNMVSIRQGRIIFLAAAGNNGLQAAPNVPARLGNVISIRSADFKGTASPNNPPLKVPYSGLSFTAIGQDVPERLCEYMPPNRRTGSSVATAVAAGITALLLSYAYGETVSFDFRKFGLWIVLYLSRQLLSPQSIYGQRKSQQIQKGRA